MSGVTYGGPPIEPLVPVVHMWLGSAVRSWTRAMYGRRGWWFAWGWLLVIFLAFVVIKVTVYWAGVLLLIVAFTISALYDLASYPLRRRAARPALGN